MQEQTGRGYDSLSRRFFLWPMVPSSPVQFGGIWSKACLFWAVCFDHLFGKVGESTKNWPPWRRFDFFDEHKSAQRCIKFNILPPDVCNKRLFERIKFNILPPDVCNKRLFERIKFTILPLDVCNKRLFVQQCRFWKWRQGHTGVDLHVLKRWNWWNWCLMEKSNARSHGYPDTLELCPPCSLQLVTLGLDPCWCTWLSSVLPYGVCSGLESMLLILLSSCHLLPCPRMFDC